MSEAPATGRALAWKAPTSATLSTSSSVAVQREENRKYLIICNDDSSIVVYLSVGSPAVVNSGIRLNPEGGSFEMSEKLGNLCPHDICAVATAGTPVITIQEAV